MEFLIRLIPDQNRSYDTLDGLRILEELNHKVTCGKRLFSVQIRSQDTLIVEDINNNGSIESLRIRNVSNPPPATINTSHYKSVRQLMIYCPINVKWIFGFIGKLPALENIKFGLMTFKTSCKNNVNVIDYDKLYSNWKPNINYSVKKLTIEADQLRLHKKGQDLERLVKAVNEILYYSGKCLKNLNSIKFWLPVESNFSRFLDALPQFQVVEEFEASEKYENGFGVLLVKCEVKGRGRIIKEDPSRPLVNYAASTTVSEPSSTMLAAIAQSGAVAGSTRFEDMYERKRPRP